MTLKAAIFDFDGVLVDSFPALFTWLKFICTKTGKEFPYLTIDQYRENHIEPVYPDMYNLLGFDWESEKEMIHTEYRRFVDNINVPVFEGIEKVIQELNSRKIPLAIASSGLNKTIRKRLQSNKIEKYFDIIIGKDDVPIKNDGEPKIKPFPDCLLIALNKLNCSPLETVYFGDQPVDIEAARRVKDYLGEAIPVVSTTYGYVLKEKVLAANPDMYIDEPEDILKIL